MRSESASSEIGNATESSGVEGQDEATTLGVPSHNAKVEPVRLFTEPQDSGVQDENAIPGELPFLHRDRRVLGGVLRRALRRIDARAEDTEVGIPQLEPAVSAPPRRKLRLFVDGQENAPPSSPSPEDLPVERDEVMDFVYGCLGQDPILQLMLAAENSDDIFPEVTGTLPIFYGHSLTFTV